MNSLSTLNSLNSQCLKIARQAIEVNVRYGKTPCVKSGIIICDEESFKGWKLDAGLTQKTGGVYTEIFIGSKLRGRMGTVSGTRECLAEEIIQSAIWAATKDSEFEAISPEELEEIKISLYILGEKTPLTEAELDLPHPQSKDKSILVTAGWRSGLALFDGSSPKELLQRAIKKASVENESFLQYSLETQVIKEQD